MQSFKVWYFSKFSKFGSYASKFPRVHICLQLLDVVRTSRTGALLASQQRALLSLLLYHSRQFEQFFPVTDFFLRTWSGDLFFLVMCKAR